MSGELAATWANSAASTDPLEITSAEIAAAIAIILNFLIAMTWFSWFEILFLPGQYRPTVAFEMGQSKYSLRDPFIVCWLD